MTNTKSTPTELGTEPIPQLLFKYAVPAIISMVVASLYNIIDSIFIGHIPNDGPRCITALAIAFPLMNLSAAFGSLVGAGGSTLVSIKLGQKDYPSANKVLGNVTTLNIIIGVVIMLLGLFFLDEILVLFGASDETIDPARDFMTVLLIGNVFTHLFFGLNHVMRSSGNPRKAMFTTILTVVNNIILAPIFIYMLGWGITGAALATITAQTISLVVICHHFYSGKDVLTFSMPDFKLQKQIVKSIFAIGVAPFTLNACACLVAMMLNNTLYKYGGDNAIGAYGICNRVIMIGAQIVFGFNQAMQPIAGYNFGAQLVDRVDKVLKMTIVCATCVTFVLFFCCECFADGIVSIFVNQDEGNALALMESAAHGLRIVVIMMPIVGFQMVVSNFFQSIGRAPISLFMSATRQLIYLIPLVWLLPQKFGLDGVWYAMPTSDFLAAMTAIVIFKTQYKKSLTLPNKETKVDVEKKNVDSDHLVISIGRQFGAGGRQIGKLIADHYGIKYYDSELLVEAAKDMGFAPEIFAKADEVPSLQNSLDRLADLSSPNTSESVLSGANLFKAQSETMQRIADSESCVIVGRASDYVLRDRKDLVTFFLRAPMEFRAENIASRHNIDIKKAQKLVEERESARKEYYDYYTGREWGDSKGYDLCVDVSKLGLEETAKMMIAFIDSVFGKKAEK